MIIDHIDNAPLYYGISEDVKESLEYLKERKYPTSTTARYQVGENTSFNVNEYITKPFEKAEWEAHDHCIDLQFVIKGEETISYGCRCRMHFESSHPQKDRLAYTGEGDVLELKEGYFCILFPDDVYRTKTMLNQPSAVTKGVFKISLK